MPEDIVGCTACQPALVLSTERKNDGHYSVKFSSLDSEVRIDGRKSVRTFEVQTGPGGWAISMTEPTALCPCTGKSFSWTKHYTDNAEVKEPV